MLVQEALEAAGATGANLQQVWGALKTCDFAPEMPADAAFINFGVSQHLPHLSPRLQGYIIAAQRQAAGQGAVQLEQLQLEQANLQERVSAMERRRKTSITLAETHEEEGRGYLEAAASLQLDDVVVPLDPVHAHHLAAAATDPLQAARQGSGEGPVQELMLVLAEEIQRLTCMPGRGYFDTSQTGLPILPAGRRAKPDLAACEGDACASNVSIIMEAKPSLEAHASDCEATFQVVQRSLQLQNQQRSRTKWTFASVGAESVRLFHIHTCNERVTSLAVTDRLPLSAAVDSPGLQALLRLHSTPAERLGWLPSAALLPTDLQLGGQGVRDLYSLMPVDKPSTRSAQVVAGVVDTSKGSLDVYCKTSTCVDAEIAAFQKLQEYDISGIATLRGQCRDAYNRVWLIATPVEKSTLHTYFPAPADVCKSILKVARTVHAMAQAGLHHGDISPANILSESATLIDFQTLWHAQAPLLAKLTFSYQFVAIDRLDNPGMVPTLETELESVQYVFLYAATKDQLRWKHSSTEIEALNAKGLAMHTSKMFERKVVPRIRDQGLKEVARKLRSLFNDGSQKIDLHNFEACFSS